MLASDARTAPSSAPATPTTFFSHTFDARNPRSWVSPSLSLVISMLLTQTFNSMAKTRLSDLQLCWQPPCLQSIYRRPILCWIVIQAPAVREQDLTNSILPSIPRPRHNPTLPSTHQSRPPTLSVTHNNVGGYRDSIATKAEARA